MAHEVLDHILDVSDQRIVEESGRSPSPAAESSLSRSGSSSRLNAMAPEFVPRATAPTHNPSAAAAPRMVKIQQHHGHPKATASPHVSHVYHGSPRSSRPTFLSPMANHGGSFEYFGGGGNGVGFLESGIVTLPPNQDPVTPVPTRDPHWNDVVQKVTKQVEYYFSDVNLATTEHLMKFISRDPEGFVPISVIGSFKKIKALVHSNADLASALRSSTKLVVSEDDSKVRRQHPFTETDVEELQSRIIVAENLPEDHCYQNLMRIFSAVGSVKMIRTCYPPATNGTAVPSNKSTKMDILFGNKLHAFVEYENVEDAEKAVCELNDERNWRNGLRVRLLIKCMNNNKHCLGCTRKGGDHEDDGNGLEEDVSAPHDQQLQDYKLIDGSPQQNETTQEQQQQQNLGEESSDRESGGRRGRGRGRGARGRGRGGQYHHTNSNTNNNARMGAHPVGTLSSGHAAHSELPKQPPPGPRMPDGTRGFTMGRGKPLALPSTSIVSG